MKNGNNHLNFAKKLKDDEYYTRRFVVYTIFDSVLKSYDPQRTLFVLGADSDVSYYAQYCKSHQLHYVNNIDIFDSTEFIKYKANGWTILLITNPPFSKCVNLLAYLQPSVFTHQIEICLIINLITIASNTLINYFHYCYLYPFNGKMSYFWHDGELKSVNVLLLSSRQLDWPVHPKPPTVPTGEQFTTPVTRIIYKHYYEACGYHLVGLDQSREHSLFKRYIWEKNKNNSN